MTTHAAQFAGRTGLFNWILQNLNRSDCPPVILLTGTPQIGKTAVLQQIQQGRLGPDSVPIYVDLTLLSQHTTSSLFWDLAQTALSDFNQKRRLPIALTQSDFVAGPQQALTKQFIQPLKKWLDGRRLLLLLDNLQTLNRNGEGILDEPTVNLLTWLRRQTAVTSILTLTQETPELTPDWAGVLAGIERFSIAPLQLEEVTELLRQSQPTLLVKSVIQQIYESTGGEPTAVLKICDYLQSRLKSGRINQITLADLAMAHKIGVGHS